MSINAVSLSGRLTRDAEQRSTQSGKDVLAFSLAFDDRRKNPQSGQWEDVPNYIDCTLFGNLGRALAPSMTKGAKVALQGRLRWSQWESGGQKRSKVEVIVDEIELMQRRGQQEPQGQQGQLYDEDIPF